jgi:ATP/maltotriose-dependent transcriptional regulator MalT
MHEPGRAELLLERDRELESLRAALAEAVGGEGRLALVEGPAGIGKSRLLAELRSAAAEEDVRVLTARGSELEREFPFGVVRQLFAPSTTTTPASAGSQRVPEAEHRLQARAPPGPRGKGLTPT